MSTLNIIISKFRTIADNHLQIKSFGIGDAWEIGASSASLTPELWINPTGAFMEKQDTAFSSTVYTFNMKCYDLVDKDELNENEVLSDCLQILQDVVSEFSTAEDMQLNNILVNSSVSFLPFTESFDQEVSGWEASIEIIQPFNDCSTSKPIER